jgi:predicted PolB exonuclease-like 3'-5' exonuclease
MSLNASGARRPSRAGAVPGCEPGMQGRSPGGGIRAPSGGEAMPRVVGDAEPHDALLALDVETVVDPDLLPDDWNPERFAKPAWHRIVAISFVELDIVRDGSGRGETYRMRACRSGGEPGWDEGRLLRAFWKFFAAGHYRLVTWNGRSFDVPTMLLRSMRHGIATPAWFRRGSRWAGYGHRYATDWHTDLMEVLADHGASPRLGLGEAAALVGAPGKLGEHGAKVAEMMDAGQLGRIRDYCETDCLNLVIVYLRWAHLTGRTDAGGHDAAIRGVADYLEAQRDERPHLGRFLDVWRSLDVRLPSGT